MKNSSEKRTLRVRLIMFFALTTLLLAALDLAVHHHAIVCLLPDFARYVVISLLGSLVLIGLALCLAPVVSRMEDYYDK